MEVSETITFRKRGKKMSMLQGKRAIMGTALLALLLGGCAYAPYMGSPQKDQPAPPAGVSSRKPVSPAVSPEDALGTSLFSWVEQKGGGVYAYNNIASLLERIAARLQQAGGPAVRLRAINNSRPAIFIFPGSRVGITRGLLLALEDEAQLAALIAHQMGHVPHCASMLKHPNTKAALQMDTGKIAYDADVRAALKLAAAWREWRFTEAEELEANRTAEKLLAAAGYDPAALNAAQNTLRKAQAAASEASKTRWQNHSLALVSASGVSGNRPESGFGLWRKSLGRRGEGYTFFDSAIQREREKNARSALNGYQQASELLPGDQLVLTYIGLSYLNAGKLENAQSYLEKALDIDNRYYASHQGMGYLMLQRGNFAGAVNELESALRLLPSQQGSYLLAEAYLGNGESDSAASLFEQVAAADPDGKLGKAATRRLRNLKKSAPSPAGQQ